MKLESMQCNALEPPRNGTATQYPPNGSSHRDQEAATDKIDSPLPEVLTVGKLLATYPQLRRPIVHGLLREGETMNIIASPKTGKSWLATDLALAVATGRPWLSSFPTEAGNVLIIDNELHAESSANRIPKVAAARGIDLDEFAEKIRVANLRGHLTDLLALHRLFKQFQPGELGLVIVDAFYRAIPIGTDENDNGAVAAMYNAIDRYALELGCSFVLIHHTSKGSQSGKTITDVGAGAGSQSRAADTHLVLRPHSKAGVVVLDAAVRSWPPIDARCLQWQFPVFNRADELDPLDLRPERPSRQKASKKDPQGAAAPRPLEWTRERFAAEIVGTTPHTTASIMATAIDKGLSTNKARELLRHAAARGDVHRWKFGHSEPHQFATAPQPSLQLDGGGGGEGEEKNTIP